MSDLIFEKVINLTTYDKNTPPLLVHNLCMVNESNNELVQYYIDDDSFAEDKAANIKNNNYDTVEWGNKGKRLTFRNVSRIGVKAFPGIGAVAYFKDKYRGTCNIIAPVNYEGREYMTPPVLQMTDNGATLTFKVIPPPDIVYFCYRIVLDNNGFAYEYITYDLELTIDKPDVKGEYHIYCTGYINEGEYTSADSNIITLNVTEGRENFDPIPEESFYTKAEIDSLLDAKIDKYVKSAAFVEEGKKLLFNMSDDTSFYASGQPAGGGVTTPITVLNNTFKAFPGNSTEFDLKLNCLKDTTLLAVFVARSDIVNIDPKWTKIQDIPPIVSSLTTDRQTLYLYSCPVIEQGEQNLHVTLSAPSNSTAAFLFNIAGVNNFIVGNVQNVNIEAEEVDKVTINKSSKPALVFVHNQWAHKDTVIKQYNPQEDCILLDAGSRFHTVIDNSNVGVHDIALGSAAGSAIDKYKVTQVVTLNLT